MGTTPILIRYKADNGTIVVQETTDECVWLYEAQSVIHRLPDA